ncbi:MAG: PAS domain S-box protein [Gammaproteobacteria bacterium]
MIIRNGNRESIRMIWRACNLRRAGISAKPEQGFQQQFRFRHKNGSYRWIYTQASLVYDARGKASHMLGSHIGSITEHQQLAAQQHIADRQRAALLESAYQMPSGAGSRLAFHYVSRKAGELINRRPEALLGKHIWTEIPEAVGQEFYYVYQKAMTERLPIRKKLSALGSLVREPHVSRPGRRFECYFTDVTARKQTETLLAGQKYVLELMAANTPLSETLDALLQVIEAQAPKLHASVLLLDNDGVHMRHAAAPSLPQSYTEALDGLAIGPQVGSCGTAMFRREAVIVEDIASDPLWEDYRELALAHGLRACWSKPLLDVGGKVLGSFAFYFSQPGRPTERHNQLIDSTAHLTTITIRRHHEEAALRASEARYIDLYEQAPDMHCSVDANTGLLIHCNQRLLDVTGYTRDEVIGQLVWSLCHPDDQDAMYRLWQQFFPAWRDSQRRGCASSVKMVNVAISA